MKALAKKHKSDFFRAQEEVREALSPYHARCLDQFFSERTAIESFVVYSKDIDQPDDRYSLRGIVTVWYGMPIQPGDRCSVNLAFDAGMVGCSAPTVAEMLAKALPPLKS